MRPVVALLCSLAGSALITAAEQPRGAKLPAQLTVTAGVKVRLELQGSTVIAHYAKKQQKLSDYDQAELGTEADPVLIADFNFDGCDDVAILEGNGYGGVNLFYRLWLWDKTREQFSEFRTPVSNPSLKTRQKLLMSGQRSGPRWYQTIFRATGGRLSVYAEAEMLNEPTLWGVRFFDELGSESKRAVLESADLDALPAAYQKPVRRLRSAACLKPQPAQITQKEVEVQIVGFGPEDDMLQVATAKGSFTVSTECIVPREP